MTTIVISRKSMSAMLEILQDSKINKDQTSTQAVQSIKGATHGKPEATEAPKYDEQKASNGLELNH
jgi:hypothetical protein